MVLCSHWSFECTAVPLLGQGPAICCTIIDLGYDLSSERILKLVFPRMRERHAGLGTRLITTPLRQWVLVKLMSPAT